MPCAHEQFIDQLKEWVKDQLKQHAANAPETWTMCDQVEYETLEIILGHIDAHHLQTRRVK